MMTKSDEGQYKIRMPKRLHRMLEREAEKRGQTINAEILRRLQESFETGPSLKDVSETVKATHVDLAELKKAFLEGYQRASSAEWRAIFERLKQTDKTEGPQATTSSSTGDDDEQGQHQTTRRE